MAFYDKDRLLEEATSLMIVEYLGVDHIAKGGYVYIKCPGHLDRLGKEDAHFGNCVLTEKGYHCFACGITVNIVQMVREIQDCDYPEALGIIGDALGGRNNYTLSGTSIPNLEANKQLVQSDLELLGLKPNISIDEIHFISNDKKYISNEGYIPKIPPNDIANEIYLATTHKSYSLRTLRIEDPCVYYTLIKNKAKEAMDKYQFMMDVVCDRTSKESILLLPLCQSGELDDEIIYDFKHLYMDMYNRCKEIYMEIDAEMCGDVSNEVIEEPPKIPHYNLFD